MPNRSTPSTKSSNINVAPPVPSALSSPRKNSATVAGEPTMAPSYTARGFVSTIHAEVPVDFASSGLAFHETNRVQVDADVVAFDPLSLDSYVFSSAMFSRVFQSD